MAEFSEITINELAIRCRSKKEVYNLLCSEGAAYLPPVKVQAILLFPRFWLDIKVFEMIIRKGLYCSAL